MPVDRLRHGAADVISKVSRLLSRFRPKEAEAKSTVRQIDPVAEAGEESFPASDPPSFTPEKST